MLSDWLGMRPIVDLSGINTYGKAGYLGYELPSLSPEKRMHAHPYGTFFVESRAAKYALIHAFSGLDLPSRYTLMRASLIQ